MNEESLLGQTDVHSLAFPKYCSLFQNRFGGYVRSRQVDTWRSTSKYFYLSDDDMLALIFRSKSIVRAVESSALESVICFEISADSQFHSIDGISRLKKSLMAIGLRKSHLYQIDQFETWALYFFLDTAYPADALQSLIEKQFVDNYLDPSSMVTNLNSHLVLPLQHDFAWLSDSCEVEIGSSELPPILMLERFLADSESTNSLDQRAVEHLSRFEEETQRSKTAFLSSMRSPDELPGQLSLLPTLAAVHTAG